MNLRSILAASMGVIIAFLAVLAFMLMGREDRATLAAAVPDPDVEAERQAPATRADPMTPVTSAEADRRSVLHERLAESAAAEQAAVMAPPVVTEVRTASPYDSMSRRVFGVIPSTTPEPAHAQLRPRPRPVPEPDPEVVEAAAEPEPEPEPARDVVEPAPRFLDPAQFRDRFPTDATRRPTRFGVRNLGPGIEGPMQFDSGALDGPLLGSPTREQLLGEEDLVHLAAAGEEDGWFEPFQVAGGFAPEEQGPFVRPQYDVPQVIFPGSQPVTGYGGPLPEERSAARPALVGVDAYGDTFTTSEQPNPYLAAQSGAVVLARSGDLLVANLLYGFNSDDVRGLPIYAVVRDYLPNGTQGPLDGARIQGQVAFSTDNAAILFDTAVLADGRELPINAIAVSLDSGATGVAASVDRHNVARYGSLFLAGIIQGFGEVGLARLSGSDGSVVIVNEGDGAVSAGSGGSDDARDVLAGSLAPLGQNLSAAAASGFDRPPTISAPAGLPFAVVFLSTLVSEPGATQTAFNPRTGRVGVIGTVEAAASPDAAAPSVGAPLAPALAGDGTLPGEAETFTPAAEGSADAVWQSLGASAP